MKKNILILLLIILAGCNNINSSINSISNLSVNSNSNLVENNFTFENITNIKYENITKITYTMDMISAIHHIDEKYYDDLYNDINVEYTLVDSDISNIIQGLTYQIIVEYNGDSKLTIIYENNKIYFENQDNLFQYYESNVEIILNEDYFKYVK